ncbi:site-specific DNA-methyltransferase [Roseicyclus marinus]|uniref:site-specific DNA-methyltransferase (adenine-specific) n=1 Tax=Roseicyclus marinus TaxID=2161673 RepID=A0AA48KIG8_9RHOB|nr:restriction endonuclease subunit M [Roseicyclus marinus]
MNHLHYGDNLAVLRNAIADASVDLVYLDPPFNSNASYNVLFKGPSGSESTAQIEAFDDTWHWTDAAEEAFGDVLRSGNGAAAEMLRAMRSFLGENDMMAYLAMMAVRLLELHRVLKPTGSLYLHCDPTASHYLKILLDAVFGPKSFRTEISWRRQSAHNDAAQGRKQPGNVRDIIFFYSKSNDWTWNWQYTDYDESYVEKHYRHIEAGTGRRYRLGDITAPGGADPKKRNPFYEFLGVKRYWRYSEERMKELFVEGRIIQTAPGRVPQYKRYLDEMKGVAIQNDWTDILPLHAAHAEKLDYPTQKPVALLERILSASSNPGDIVLDPFCGCGTTVHAAQKLGRNWIGIDVTHLAIGLIEKRLRDAFPDVAFTIHGVPQDIAGARDLANRGRTDKKYYFEFEKWALSLINAQPGNLGKRGADRGIDGNIYFGKTSRAIVSVKAGDNVGVSMIRDLVGTIQREKAEIGVFLTLTPPTKPMVAEAAAAGQYEEDGFAPVPRLQIVTIEEALQLRDRAVRLPARRDDTFKRAAREKDGKAQGQLDL